MNARWLTWLKREWSSPIYMVSFSFLLLCAFWLAWVYLGTGEAPMNPEVLIRIFWTVFKFSVFMATAWIFTYAYFRYAGDEPVKLSDIDQHEQFRVWAVILFCLSLCSLG